MYMSEDDEDIGGIDQFRKKREPELSEVPDDNENETTGEKPAVVAKPDVIASAVASKPMDISQYMVSPDEIKASAEQKAKNARIAGIFDALANRETAGSFGSAFLGATPNKIDSSKQVEAQNALADAPIIAKQQALKNAVAKQALEKANLEYKKAQELESEQRDPEKAKNMLNLYAQQGVNLPQGMSQLDIKNQFGVLPGELMKEKLALAAKEKNAQLMATRGMVLNQDTGQYEPKAKQLAANNVEGISDLLSGADASMGLEDLSAHGLETGKKAAIGDWLKGTIGTQSQDRAKSLADMANQFNKFKKSVSGTAVSPSEREDLLKGIPTNTDAPEAFRGKAQSTTDNMINKAESQLAALQASGYDTSKLQAMLEAKKAKLQQIRGGVSVGNTQSALPSKDDIQAEILRRKQASK